MCHTLIGITTYCIFDTQVYQAVKGVIDSYDALVDLLESIDHFLNRLDIYTKILPTVAMTEMVVKILVELLSALALVTKQIKQGKPSEPIFREGLYYLTQPVQKSFLRSSLEIRTSRLFSTGWIDSPKMRLG